MDRGAGRHAHFIMILFNQTNERVRSEPACCGLNGVDSLVTHISVATLLSA